MPVHGRVQVTLIRDMDNDLGALSDLEGGTGDGAVVAQHADGAVAEPFGDGPDVEVQGAAVGQLQQCRPSGLGQPGGIGRE
jgi:hypothetical protein